MQPGFDLRIRTMNKALTQLVLPAVDSNNKAAIEQLQIVIGSLELMREQIDYAHWFEVVDGKSLIALTEQVAKDAGRDLGADVASAVASVQDATSRYDLTLTSLRNANARLREALSHAIETVLSDCDAAVSKKLSTTVIEMSREQISRERAYVAKTNFDVFPDTLLSIPESLANASV